MEFNRFSQRLTVTIAMVLGLISAVVLGRMAAMGRISPIMMVGFGALGVGLLLTLKERIWMLLLLTWPMTGQIRALNIPFGVRDLGVLFVCASYFLLIAFKVVRRSAKITTIDLLMLLVGLIVVGNFIRNPVGVEALGSERVGGRPYFNVIVALLAWAVLSRAQVGSMSPWTIFGLFFAGRCLDGLLATILHFIPDLAVFFSDFYSAPILTSGYTEDSPMDIMQETSGRLTFLGFIAVPFLTGLFAWKRPLAWLNILKPWMPLLLLCGATMMLKSGFRSALAILAFIGFVSGYLRKGWPEVYKMIGLGVFLLFIVVPLNGTLFELPRGIQRTLSFLPGKWDRVAIAEAEESTDWRIFMWKEALFTDRYIQNKVIGDGFGIDKSDYAVMEHASRNGGTAGVQENLMLAGNFHSGPVTSIHNVGYVGLVFYVVLLLKVSKDGWRLCCKYRNTRYEVPVFFICLPFIVEPAVFLLIFGAFDSSFPEIIFTIGMMKLMDTIASEYRATVEENHPAGAVHNLSRDDLRRTIGLRPKN